MTPKVALRHLVSGEYTWEHRKKCKKIIEKEFEDLQWLKSHICWDLLDQLNTEDKLKLLEIMGVNYD